MNTLLTADGLERLRGELRALKSQTRKDIAARLHAICACEIPLNAEYEAIKEKQALAEDRIHELEVILGSADVIDATEIPDRIVIGSYVTLQEHDEAPQDFQIVSPPEADLESGCISSESPLGAALLGHQIGDEVLVNVPDGEICVRVLAIRFRQAAEQPNLSR